MYRREISHCCVSLLCLRLLRASRHQPDDGTYELVSEQQIRAKPGLAGNKPAPPAKTAPAPVPPGAKPASPAKPAGPSPAAATGDRTS